MQHPSDAGLAVNAMCCHFYRGIPRDKLDGANFLKDFFFLYSWKKKKKEEERERILQEAASPLQRPVDAAE